MKKVAILQFFFLFLYLFSILNPISAYAEVFSSSSFRIVDPVIGTGLGYGTSTSFGLFQSMGGLSFGSSSAPTFALNSGFLNFPKITIPQVTGTSGDGQATLSWTASVGSLGWTVTGYDVGRATALGGPYTYTSVGDTLSSTRTGLTNLTKYYFVVRPEDAFGTTIATSSEVLVIPEASGASVIATTTQAVYIEQGATVTLENKTSGVTDGTTAQLVVPENFTTEAVELQATSYPKSVVEAEKPAPSGKSFVGKVYDFSWIATSTGAAVATLDVAVEISITYATNDVSGLDESTLKPYRREEGDTSWTLISGATVNTSTNTIVFSTAQFSSFAIFGDPPAPVAESSSPSPSSGGNGPVSGGGSGGGGAPATITGSIVLQGKGYPNASVSVLLDGVFAKKIIADKTGVFSVTIGALSGAHQIGIFAEDTALRRSLTSNFPIVVVGSAPTSVSGIVLPPTFDLKAENTAPRVLIVSGSSQSLATVVLTFNSSSEIVHNTTADVKGLWSQTLDTSILEEGEHIVRAQAFFPDKIQTIFSESRTFTVLPTGILIAKKVTAIKGPGDLSGDSRVNLIDFSILLFNWGTPSNPDTDLNKDGKVNITDFSILLFHWSG